MAAEGLASTDSAKNHKEWSASVVNNLSLPIEVKISLPSKATAGRVHNECKDKINYLRDYKDLEMFKIGFCTDIQLRWNMYKKERRWSHMTILAAPPSNSIDSLFL